MGSWYMEAKEFEDKVRKIATSHFHTEFVSQKLVQIGNPSKNHSFDLVSIDESIIIECKNFTWTKANNVPSAKISTLNEAVLFFKLSPAAARKILVIRYSLDAKRKETLAEYYVRTYRFVLDDVEVYELSENEDELHKIN